MSGFQVDPESLRATDDQIGSVFQSALADIERLEAETAAEDAPWGGDDLGTLIGEVYQGAYAMAFNCLYSNLDTMGDYSHQLSVVADAYDAVEQEIAQQLARIGSALG